jgi:hypothetical protein
LQHAKNAGDLLIEAKKQCGHGNWLPWVKTTPPFGYAASFRRGADCEYVEWRRPWQSVFGWQSAKWRTAKSASPHFHPGGGRHAQHKQAQYTARQKADRFRHRTPPLGENAVRPEPTSVFWGKLVAITPSAR